MKYFVKKRVFLQSAELCLLLSDRSFKKLI